MIQLCVVVWKPSTIPTDERIHSRCGVVFASSNSGTEIRRGIMNSPQNRGHPERSKSVICKNDRQYFRARPPSNIPKFYEGLLSMGRVFITTACFVIVIYVSNLNCKNYLPAKTQDQLTHKGSRGPRTGVFGKFTHKTFFRRCLRRFWSFFLWLVWLHCSLVGWYCFRCLFALIYLLSSIIPPDSTCKKRTCWSSDRGVVVVVVVVDSRGRDVRTTWRLRPFLKLP